MDTAPRRDADAPDPDDEPELDLEALRRKVAHKHRVRAARDRQQLILAVGIIFVLFAGALTYAAATGVPGKLRYRLTYGTWDQGQLPPQVSVFGSVYARATDTAPKCDGEPVQAPVSPPPGRGRSVVTCAVDGGVPGEGVRAPDAVWVGGADGWAGYSRLTR